MPDLRSQSQPLPKQPHISDGTNISSLFRKVRNAPWKGGVLFAVGLLFFGWLLNTPSGWLGKADAVGYAVCHRIVVRSLLIEDRPLPLCARCSGMYLGVLAGLCFQVMRGRRLGGFPPVRLWIISGFLTLAFAVDGINSFFHLEIFSSAPSFYEPHNWLRTITGSGMGLVMAAFLYPAFGQTAWRDWENRPALSDGKAMAGLVVLVAILDAALLSGFPALLLVLAFLTTITVFIVLTLVYTMVGLILFRKENRYQKWIGLFFPLISGFGIALVQIILLEAVRFLLTGSWDGIKFG